MTNSGAYWEGGPVKLTESILARNATTKAYDSFLANMKNSIQKAKDDFDRTLNETNDIQNKSALVREKTLEDIDIDQIEQAVSEKMKNINKNEQEQKLAECFKLQFKAASYIDKLKEAMKEAEKANKELSIQARTQHETLLATIKNEEASKIQEEQNFNVNMKNRLKFVKIIQNNPPPKFESHAMFGTIHGLLAFLNEDLEEYFEDIFLDDKFEKCRPC